MKMRNGKRRDFNLATRLDCLDRVYAHSDASRTETGDWVLREEEI